MAEFTVNPHRVDPYKNFKFRIKWDGRHVAGVSKVSGLRRTTEVIRRTLSAHELDVGPEPGRDIALRCLRPRSSGRNGGAAERGADGTAHRPYLQRFMVPMRHLEIVEIPRELPGRA